MDTRRERRRLATSSANDASRCRACSRADRWIVAIPTPSVACRVGVERATTYTFRAQQAAPLRAIADPPPTTYHLPPTTYHLPPTTYHLPPTTYHLPPTTYHLLPATYWLNRFMATAGPSRSAASTASTARSTASRRLASSSGDGGLRT